MQSAGTSLDFFLISNGANGGTNTYWTNTADNPDKFNHVVALAPENSDMLVIGFEDLYGGGDKDYNDLVFAVDIGEENMAALIQGDAQPWWVFALIGIAGSLFLFLNGGATRPHAATP